MAPRATAPDSLPPLAKRELEKALGLGLVARFCLEEFGYISLHDPCSGEWCDIPTKEAPEWAKAEAFKRGDLYKAGERRFLTQKELEEIWRKEWHEAEGIAENAEAVNSKGIVYEDYLGEE